MLARHGLKKLLHRWIIYCILPFDLQIDYRRYTGVAYLKKLLVGRLQIRLYS